MKFKTLRTSKSGQKFQNIVKKKEECWDARSKLSDKWGFTKFRPDIFDIWGGLSSIIFEKEPDMKIWRKLEDRDEYFPRKNIKAGKELVTIIKALPTISRDELNMCVGFNGAPFSTIGFDSTAEKYFLFSIAEDWDFKPPSDCKEITVTEYKSLSKSKD